MRTDMKKMRIFALAIPAFVFFACSSDSSVQVFTPDGESYDEDEYVEMMENGEIDAMGNRIKEESGEVKTTSSASKVSSSSTDKSSSSEAKSSSSEKPTSSEAKSSSSEKPTSSEAKSSSSEKPASSETPKSSSSEAGSSSSTEPEAGVETIVDGSNFSIGTDDMEEVENETKTELDSLKEVLDNGGTVDGFEKLESEFNEETLTYESFDEGDYYCFVGEGEWMHVTRELLGEYIPHYRNGHAWGNLSHFDVKFMDACSGVYFRRK